MKLSLSMVAPLLDLIREITSGLATNLAVPLKMQDLDDEFRDAWTLELLASQRADLDRLLALFDSAFFASGVVAFDEDNAESIVRSCSAIRLGLRSTYLRNLDDDAMESGEVAVANLGETERKAFLSYLFLAKIQELIIEHLDSVILDGNE